MKIKKLSTFLLTMLMILTTNMFSISGYAAGWNDSTKNDQDNIDYNLSPCHWYIAYPVDAGGDYGYGLDIAFSKHNCGHKYTSWTTGKEIKTVREISDQNHRFCDQSTPETDLNKYGLENISVKLNGEYKNIPIKKNSFKALSKHYYNSDDKDLVQAVKDSFVDYLHDYYKLDDGFRMLKKTKGERAGELAEFLYPDNALKVPHTETKTKIVKGTDDKTESKYCLVKLTQIIKGDYYKNKTNNYNNVSSLNSTVSDSNKCSTTEDYKKLFESPTGLSLSKDVNYGVTSSSAKVEAKYLLINKITSKAWTRKDKYTYHYDGNGKLTKTDVSKGTKKYTNTSEPTYTTGDSFTTTLNGNKIKNTINVPDYKLLQWTDLNTEDYAPKPNNTNLFPSITGDSSKKNVEVGYKKLDYSLTTDKNPGEILKLVSDNNPRSFSITYAKDSIFGVPTSYINQIAEDSNSTVDKSGFTLRCGDQISADPSNSVAVTSLQVIAKSLPSNTEFSNDFTYGLSSKENESDYTHTYKLRSIKYGDGYYLGDRKGNKYWYTTVKYNTVNKLGFKYSSSAPGSISVSEKSRASSKLSINGTKLNNDSTIKTTFYQPILEGRYIVRDVAGKNG